MSQPPRKSAGLLFALYADAVLLIITQIGALAPDRRGPGAPGLPAPGHACFRRLDRHADTTGQPAPRGMGDHPQAAGPLAHLIFCPA